MSAIVLTYPNVASPTTTVRLNPALCRVNYRQTPLQKRLVSLSGKAYVVALSTMVDVLITLEIEDLHAADSGGNAGWTSLLTFVTTTSNWAAYPFDFTDADGVTTTVRCWSEQTALREAEGRALVAGRFTGTVVLRKEL